MAYAEIHTVTLTTNSSGVVTGYTPVVTGKVFSVIYIKDNWASGVDFTITTETTAQGLWTESDVNASTAVAPRQPTHDAIGAASLYAAAGEPVEDYIYAVNERIKIAIASGGNVRDGTFKVIIA